MFRNTKSTSILNILFLINILTQKQYTKQEIIETFNAKLNVNISRTTIDNYINIIKNNGIDIDIKKENAKNTYSIQTPFEEIELNSDAFLIFQDLKKILISKKNYFYIKNAIYLFYKIAKRFEGEKKAQIANFGYFSTLNWFVINQLEKHCYTKDILLIEYMLPNGKSKDIIVHTDKLKIQGSTNRLYLIGTLADSTQFSQLPADRIFMIKKVIRKNAIFDLPINILTYTISKKAFEKDELDVQEAIVGETKTKVTISRPIIDDFSIVQKIMSYCPDVYYISDERIKAIVKEKLEILNEMYAK